jgi:BRCT domain type II-containing protein
MAKKGAVAPIPVRRDALKGKSVIITGEIDGQTRKSAEQILINAGATIEKSLNKKVQLVVLGADAGPKKLEKIEQLGLETQEWDDLIEEIKGDGGEEPAGDDDDEDMDDAEEEEAEEVSVHNSPTNYGAQSSAPQSQRVFLPRMAVPSFSMSFPSRHPF